MVSSAQKEYAPAIVFSPPMPLTNEFYKETRASIQDAAKIHFKMYKSLGVKNTPMGEEYAKMIKHPEEVHNAEAMFGVEPTKNGEAIYSIKIITKDKEVKIFTLRVKDFIELSYFNDDKLKERHYQKGKEVFHELV